MSKVVAIEHLTLDGVMQGPARPEEDTRDGFEYGGWAAARNDPAMMEALGARMGSSWSLLVGRTTYEDLGEDYLHNRRCSREARTNRLVRKLERLGHIVTEPLVQSA